jgi:hypothetical protein
MSEAPEVEKHESYTSNGSATEKAAEVETPEQSGAGGLFRAILITAVALASVALVFAVVRSMVRRAPADPTTERIQGLIDEANRLLKQLDDKSAG